MGEFLLMAGFTSFTQLLSSAITMGKEQSEAIARDQSICTQITSTNDKINQLNSLTVTINKSAAIETDTQTMIANLQEQTTRDIQSIKDLKNSFNTKLIINIIVNIVIVLIVGVQLFI